MKKDYKKILKEIYQPKPDTAVIVTVPELNYLMINGKGYPEEEIFQKAAQTLFPIAYVSKFIIKEKKPEEDFVVMPMEVKWKLNRNKYGSERYLWTMMIMQPRCITKEIINQAKESLKKKKKELPLGDKVSLQSFNEGLCGQIYHIGPYHEPMEEAFCKLKKFLTNLNYDWEPDSHDIYFNDIRKVPEIKLKTLIRVRILGKNRKKNKLDNPFILF